MKKTFTTRHFIADHISQECRDDTLKWSEEQSDREIGVALVRELDARGPLIVCRPQVTLIPPTTNPQQPGPHYVWIRQVEVVVIEPLALLDCARKLCDFISRSELEALREALKALVGEAP